ncbi:MAG: large subunit ribosomal protein L23 [Parcubacteria group bacterium Gr01-1014_13]|nr:MAG: large subunit ribosomal protein L23 [Parcubacteria group bacterium Gr01-1014_13]
MGLLNNFLHRKQKKGQLSQIGEKQSAPVVVAKEKKAEKKVEKKESKVKAAKVHEDHAGHAHVEKKSEKKAEQATKFLGKNTTAFKVLVKPLITEKSAIAESKNKYSFVVVRSANKNQIKTAIEEVYGVKPANVNVANIEGRRVRFGRSMGKRNDYKKAIVTLPEGKTIDIHTGV